MTLGHGVSLVVRAGSEARQRRGALLPSREAVAQTPADRCLFVRGTVEELVEHPRETSGCCPNTGAEPARNVRYRLEPERADHGGPETPEPSSTICRAAALAVRKCVVVAVLTAEA
jgi:hypothetical protein